MGGYDEPVSGYWHVYSDGKRADIPFDTDRDKTYAMNSVAICAYFLDMEVVCSEVNDTHLHSILKGREGRALQKSLQTRICRYDNACKPASRGRILFSADPISSRTELLNKIIYTFRNCLDFYRGAPWNYKWGVGNIFFAPRKEEGMPISSLTVRERERLLGTRKALPETWRVNESGLILPASYINAEAVERLFGSVKAFLAFLYLRKDDEQKIKQQINRDYMEARTIQDMRAAAGTISASAYGIPLEQLPLDKRLKIASDMIRSHQAARCESLAKALFLTLDDLNLLL